MGSFSIWHWIIVGLILAFIVIPVWKKNQKTHSRNSTPQHQPSDAPQKNVDALKNAIYESIIGEIQSRQVDSVTWARALADADGDMQKTTARYIKLRVDQLSARPAASSSRS